MSELSDDEIREAASEAGLSPREVRLALRESEPASAQVPAVRSSGGAMVAAPTRGTSVHHVENAIALPAPDAVGAVRSALERELGAKGHRHGENAADIVDEQHGLTYRVRGEDDGKGGALVRVDVDPAQARTSKTLWAVSGVATGAVAAGLLALIGAGPLLFFLGTAGAMGLSIWGFVRADTRQRRGMAHARHAASSALVAAEEEAARREIALPPGEA